MAEDNTRRTAYDISYLNDVIDLHALLFVKLSEMEQFDTCSMIDTYMRHSEIRAKMDKGNWSALNKGYKQLLHSIDTERCVPRGDTEEYDRILLHWVAAVYVTMQWRYCIPSAEISERIPAAELIRMYSPLSETSCRIACEKLYKKFFADRANADGTEK